MLVEILPAAVAPSPVVGVAKSPYWRKWASAAEPYLYIIPALAGVLLWIYRPLIETFDYSFYSWNLLPTSPKLNVGWSNYSQLFHLHALWQALGTSVFFMVGLLIFGLFLPVVIGALTENISPKARVIYRGLVFLPVLVSPVVTATIWEFLLAPAGGFVDTVLGWLGFGQTNWLQQPNTAKYAIIAISGWKILGISVLITVAGLSAISTDYYEAASIDGANRKQIFRKITLPLLSPTIVFLFMFAVLLSSQIVFPLVNVLTQGGPSGSTTDIYYFLYNYGFSSFDVGLASAAAVCFFLLFSLVALVCLGLADRFSNYDN